VEQEETAVARQRFGKKSSRSNGYTPNDRRAVGRGVFCAVRDVPNTQYIIKGK
jgi:hypothetical protein